MKTWIIPLWVLAAAASADAMGGGRHTKNFGNENAGTTTVTTVVGTTQYKYSHQLVRGKLLGKGKRIGQSRVYKAFPHGFSFRLVLETELGPEGLTVSDAQMVISFQRYWSLSVTATVWPAPFLPITVSIGAGCGFSIRVVAGDDPGELSVDGSVGVSGHADAAIGVPGWRVGVRGYLEILNAQLVVQLAARELATITFSTMYVKFELFAEALFGWIEHSHDLTPEDLSAYAREEIDLLNLP